MLKSFDCKELLSIPHNNKKRFIIGLILVTLVFFNFCSAYGQFPSNLKAGAYKNLNDLLSNNPQYERKFIITKRSDLALKTQLSNDFKVVADSDMVHEDTINTKVFAVYDGTNLYFNGININGKNHFCLVENSYKRLLVLKAGIPDLLKEKEVGFERNMVNNSFISIEGTVGGVIGGVVGGAIGGAIGGALTASEINSIRFYYVFDCKSNTANILTRPYLLHLLKDYPDLNEEFDAEYDLDNQRLLLNYIRLINEK